MEVTVFLYGTLRERVKGYQHHRGYDVELPAGALSKDILTILGISREDGAVVIQDGKILKMDETVKGGTRFNIMQSIHGG